MKLSDLGEAAFTYAAAGLSVHPLPPGEKKSRLPWGERQRVAMTADEVAKHWRQNPEDNVAIITGQLSGVVVVDVDPAHRGDPAPFMGTTPFVARTRSGGWHFYYRHPGRHVKSCAGPNPDLPGVDVRGDGGYVVAPPSRVEPGEYTWEDHFPILWPSGRLAKSIPSFEVVEHLIFPPSSPAPASAESPLIVFEAITGDDRGWLTQVFTKGAPIGEQRQTLTKLAGYFASKGVPSDIAYGILYSQVIHWKQNKNDPWMPAQVRDLVESIYDRDARRRAADPLVGETGTTADAPPAGAGSVSPDYLGFEQGDEFIERHSSDDREKWLVEDWLPEGTVAMIQSPPGSYKTWMLCDLVVSVAGGHPFLGKYPVHRPGPVLFIQQEDPRSQLAFRLGIIKIAKERLACGALDPDVFWLRSPTPFHLSTNLGFVFGQQAPCEALVRKIETERPVLVILDPLYSACPPGQFFIEMPTHIRWLRRLRDRYGCAFLLAHHTKKLNHEVGDQGREQMFGSNLMNAAIESGWIVRRLKDGAISVRRHFKAAADIEARRFDFKVSADEVIPYAVEESELSDPAVDASEKDQLDGDHQLILATLRQEGKPMATRTLANTVDKPLTSVQRKVGDLIRRGLLLRNDKKQLVLTQVEPQEVA